MESRKKIGRVKVRVGSSELLLQIKPNQTTNKQKSENQTEIIIIYPAIRKF